MSYLPNVITEDDFINLAEEVEEQACTMLAGFIGKVWERLDDEEPSIDDYYNF